MIERIDFFIVGAGKSGTSAMHDYLRKHPDIYMPFKKEINFFGSDLIWINGRKDVIARSPIKVHLARFNGWQGEAIVGEASAGYLLSECAPAEIHNFNPEARIIIMLRNPVDAMYAAFYQNRFGGQEPLSDFAAALAAEADRLRGHNLPRLARLQQSICYRTAYTYSDKVARWLETFGHKQVHIILYDDFKRDTASVYRDTLTFLGADTAFEPVFEVINSNQVVRSPELRDYFRRGPLPVRLARQVLPEAIRVKGSQWIRKVNSRTVARPPMDADLRRQLQAEFAPEVEKLSELLGRDLSHWVRP